MEAALTAPAGAPPPAPSPVSVRQPSKKVVAELLAAMEDITARAPSQAPRPDDSPEHKIRMLERIPEESPNVVLRTDATGVLLYANPAAAPFLAAAGGAAVGQRLATHLGDMVRETFEFGMIRGEEMELGDTLYDVTFAPVAPGFVNVYAVDITRRKRAEIAARESARQLQRSLEQTIDMLARAVEKRDPYTSGHQHRVARIAVAIATEMGLPQDRVEGLRLGAIIHDIGKIHTPAELLARPGQLMAAEIALIRRHPQSGYEIVKDVDFPWPVAQMVLQHHERMDGSGYPQGLQGEEILLEARILAVADVVEGMSSHRPYRPALGEPAALREIERMRGRWLDETAVDACLKLFREKGFTLAA